MKLRRIAIFFVIFFLLLVVGRKAGSFLVVDNPKPSDVILVLAGETKVRPERALELLSQGYAPRIILDVPTNASIYDFSEIQLAEKYIHDLPQASWISVCPILGLSTKAESKDAEICIKREGGKRVLIVTSGFHTRRALSVFRREVPEFSYSIAAASDSEQFGTRWWTHRQWSKTFFDEWLRLVWWKCLDQWH